MPPEELQNTAEQSPEMGGELTSDDAAASLAFATNLSEGQMEAQNPNPEEPQTEQQEGEDIQKEEEPQEDMEKKEDQKIRTVVQEELATFKEDLMTALNGEENED